MSYKTRAVYFPGGCVTEKPCKNRGKKCEGCYKKNRYEPKEKK